jgi:hypothetical protein
MDLVGCIIYDFELSLTQIIKQLCHFVNFGLGKSLCRSLRRLHSCVLNAFR